MNYVTYAIPFFVLMMAMEFLWGRYSGRQTYRLNDTINSLSMGLLSRVVDLLRLGFAGVVLGGLVSLLGVTPIATDSAWVWVIAFIAYGAPWLILIIPAGWLILKWRKRVDARKAALKREAAKKD